MSIVCRRFLVLGLLFSNLLLFFVRTRSIHVEQDVRPLHCPLSTPRACFRIGLLCAAEALPRGALPGLYLTELHLRRSIITRVAYFLRGALLSNVGLCNRARDLEYRRPRLATKRPWGHGQFGGVATVCRHL